MVRICASEAFLKVVGLSGVFTAAKRTEYVYSRRIMMLRWRDERRRVGVDHTWK